MADQPVESRVGSLPQIGTIAKYNFLNYFRARRFYALLAIIAFLSLLLTTLIGYFRPVSFIGLPGEPQSMAALGFYGAAWGSSVTIVVILSAAFFGGDAISGEFQNKTGYFLVPNPVRRSAIYVGKWIAALTAASIMLAIFALAVLANGLFYFPGTIPWEFEQSVAFAWIYLVAALALMFAFSSLFKSSLVSTLMGVILLFLVFTIIDEVAADVAGIEPWFSITYGAAIISNILNSPYPAHMTTERLGGFGNRTGAGFTLTVYNAGVAEGIVILLVYFAVMAVVGLVLFERKEFTS